MLIFILLSGILLLVVINLVFIIKLTSKSQDGDSQSYILKALENFTVKQSNEIKDEFYRNRKEVNENLQANRKELSNSVLSFEEKLNRSIDKLNEAVGNKFRDFGQQQSDLSHKSLQHIQNISQSIHQQLKTISDDNTKQLSQIRETVNEKLQTTLEKRLSESFKSIDERLIAVHKGLGEMQTLAIDVGGLKKVLTNVKTRGILGEYQLENILEQILSPNQYSKNVATKQGSQANVEFAVKFPGQSLDKEVWLPIDSKFPMESYSRLLDAYDSADKPQVELEQKKLFNSIDSFAKDIHDKYIDPPHTTDFGILFLPFEGLYAEIIRNTELFERLQRKYKITIAGPTTMATMLNSFKMGFNTLVMNKKSSEVWEVLKGVKSEFQNFGDVLDKANKQLNTASNTLGILQTTRINAIERKLRTITNSENGSTQDSIPAPNQDLLS